MADPMPLQILDAIEGRLQGISVAAGYNTDAGATVRQGIAPINPDELDCGPVVAVYETQDQPSDDETLQAQAVIVLTVIVEAQVRYGQDSSAQALSYLWQDLNRAVFQPDDTTLGGLVLAVMRGPRDFEYPPAGGETVAVRQAVNVQYVETYGTP
jgi:hypothetical protein